MTPEFHGEYQSKSNDMTRRKILIATLAAFLVAGWLSWPYLHNQLLHKRIMHVMQSDEVHFNGFVDLDRVIMSLDPPTYVYQILWNVASDLRDGSKADFAIYALLRICEGTWVPSTGPFYDRDRWDHDMVLFIESLERRSDLTDAQRRMLEAMMAKRALVKK
jgi:hypothetical protein